MPLTLYNFSSQVGITETKITIRDSDIVDISPGYLYFHLEDVNKEKSYIIIAIGQGLDYFDLTSGKSKLRGKSTKTLVGIISPFTDKPTKRLNRSPKSICRNQPEATFKCGECDIAQFPVLRIIPHNSPFSA